MRELTTIELVALDNMLNMREILIEKQPTHCQLEDIEHEICALVEIDRDSLSKPDLEVAISNLRELCNMGIEALRARGRV